MNHQSVQLLFWHMTASRELIASNCSSFNLKSKRYKSVVTKNQQSQKIISSPILGDKTRHDSIRHKRIHKNLMMERHKDIK